MNFREAKKLLDPLNSIQVGEITKPHGYKGHLKFNLYFEPEKLKEESVLVDVNGWLVPFFIDYQESNLSALKPIIKFEEITTEEEAEKLAHKHIHLPRQIAKRYVNLNSLQYMLGYKIIDLTSNAQGIIQEFIFNEKNSLVKVLFNETEYLIPVKGTFIKKISHKKRLVKVKIPNGLIK